MERGSGRDPDSFYVQDCRQVQNNTHTIQTLTGQISRLLGAGGAEKDLERCRKMVDDAVKTATETRAILARIREHQKQAQNPSEKNNRRMMYQKLSDNLAITARVLEDVVRRFTAEEQRYFEARRAASGLGFGRPAEPGVVISAGDAAGGDEGADLRLQKEVMDEDMEEDRCRVLRGASEEVQCLQRIYTDLQNSVEEQQDTFDTLESHLATAATDIERGREEIEYTARYAGRYAWLRQRMWAIAGGSLTVVAALAFLTSN